MVRKGQTSGDKNRASAPDEQTWQDRVNIEQLVSMHPVYLPVVNAYLMRIPSVQLVLKDDLEA